MSAPALTSRSTQSTHPSRAANSSGVNPPAGRYTARGSPVTWRSQSLTMERALTSAPLAISSLTIAVWPCATAHISAVWPRHFSTALTLAPFLSSTRAASTWPVFATTMRAVWPSALGDSTSAPAASSRSISTGLAASAASDIGDTPNEFWTFALVPARGSRETRSTPFRYTAQCRAVVPSGSGALTSAPLATSARAVAKSLDLTASTSGGTAPAASANASAAAVSMCPLHLREDLRAVPERLFRHARAVQQGQQQVGQRRLVFVFEVLVAFEPAVAPAHDDRRQRELVVRVAVRHVAAVEHDRVVQHRPLAIGHLRQLRQE